jgi:ABC-type antimicrobial peptide transport system permease subunit
MNILGMLGIAIGVIACVGITALSFYIDKHPERFRNI